jgi:hypothetical protein
MKRFIFLMLMGLSFNSFAHDESGFLDADMSAVRYITVDCVNDGAILQDKLSVQLTSNAAVGMPLISAQIAKDSYVTNITDLINNDGKPSRLVEINKGAGEYRITVDKNGTGIVDYSLEIHCMSSETGEHLPGSTLIGYR